MRLPFRIRCKTCPVFSPLPALPLMLVSPQFLKSYCHRTFALAVPSACCSSSTVYPANSYSSFTLQSTDTFPDHSLYSRLSGPPCFSFSALIQSCNEILVY